MVFAESRRTEAEVWGFLAADFTALTAYSFMLFNLLCAPCFAAMGAIRREMNSAKWTWAAIGYLTVFAYAVSLIVYQFGLLFTGGVFSFGTAAAVIVFALLLYLLLRKNKYGEYGVQKAAGIERRVTANA
jgi:ferrous iron transport protein B